MNSRSVTSILAGSPQNTIPKQLIGEIPIDITHIKTFEDFDNIYRFRHDLINAIISDCRSIPFGERPLKDILEENKIQVTHKSYFDLVGVQTPDIMFFEGKCLNIVEITISPSITAESQKVSKYALMLHFLRKNQIPYNLEIIVINPFRVFKDRSRLIFDHKLNDVVIDLIKTVCDNSNSMIFEVRQTPKGAVWYVQRFRQAEEDQTIPFSELDVKQTHMSQTNKVVHNDDIDRLLKRTPTTLTYEDKDFIAKVVEEVRGIESKLTKREPFNREKIELKLKSLGNTDEKRAFFPLPYIQLEHIDSIERSTESDLSLVDAMSSLMMDSDDPILAKFGRCISDKMSKLRLKNVSDITNEDFLFPCNFTTDERYIIGLDGPGRKEYIRKDSDPHIEEQNKHHLYSLNYDVDVSEISKILKDFSMTSNVNNELKFESNCQNLCAIKGVGLDYVQIVQSIYREVNINAMRGDRRHYHILKPTGVKGVFVLLFKGAKVRCGEMVNLVWFKVLIPREDFFKTSTDHPWAFKRMINSNTLFQSRWLSVDAHRLDHYIRCYDKILMAYFSTLNLRCRTLWSEEKHDQELSLLNLVNKDNSDLLGCIIAIYLEDRRSTSKMLQYVRYLIMTSISIYPYYDSVFDKIIEPIRSPLQLFFLKRMIQFASDMITHPIYKNYEYGLVKFDVEQKIFKDIMGGARLKLPRPIVSDPDSPTADFHEILSEMYFCMLFNKNQDDPTHSSFQILTKMLEGEDSMQKMKQENMHLGYMPNMSDDVWMKEVIQNPHSHKFSARAIEIGSKLLREDQGDLSATEILLARNDPNLNKNLNEFATFKSSSTSKHEFFDTEKKKQNSRRRCVEAVMEELKEGRYKSFDVAVDSKCEPTDFQIFKKNQIGGVREILILTLRNRVSINILETLSRNVCKFVSDEILTHGSEKFENLRDVLFDVRKKAGPRMSMFYSFDKSKWGPSFVPIQFIYLFTPFKDQLGSVYYYILDLLIRHQNKRCFYPDRLMNQWIKDPQDKLKHNRDPLLQAKKEKFLKDHQIYFINESNMGQGILHYTSSYLHAAMISFRNRLYKIICEEEKWDYNDHRDLYSSDDSVTVQSIEINKMSRFMLKLNTFLKCQEASERLFNCQTSKSKSSINPLIGEFNSLFFSNLTFYPTILKFAIASVHPQNTDSFQRMVKESYISSRQIVENGGSLELYYISSLMNKQFCESVYHTGTGMFNDLRSLGFKHIPYQLGEFPIFEPSLMLMFGPEFHNYRIYKDWDKLTDQERKLFVNSHSLATNDMINSLSEIEFTDTSLGSLLRIEAMTGPIKQLERVKQSALMGRDEIRSMIVKDPILLIRRPESSQEIIFKTCQKLLVSGAAEAMKTICASIYYGRTSASVSAKAFIIPHYNTDKRTYQECLMDIMNRDMNNIDIEQHIKFLYPNHYEYELFTERMITPILGRIRSVFEIQSIRKLSFHKIHTKLYNGISDILSHFWDGKPIHDIEENKYNRDWSIIKEYFPLIKDSKEETMDQFGSDPDERSTGLNLLIIKLFSMRDKTFKGIIFGNASGELISSVTTLVRHNSTTSKSYEMPLSDKKIDVLVNKYDFNDIYYAHNYHILSKLSGGELSCWDQIPESSVNNFMTDPSINKGVKKRVFACLMEDQKIYDVESWSERTGIIMHSWLKRQQLVGDSWKGDFDLCLFNGKNRMFFNYKSRFDRLSIYKNDFDDPTLTYLILFEMCETIGWDIKTALSKVDSGKWLCDEKNKVVVLSESNCGFMIYRSNQPIYDTYREVSLIINEDTITLYDIANKKIMTNKIGLLPCSRSPKFEHIDLNINGMSLKKLAGIGVMTNNFDVMYTSRDVCLDALDDIKMEKPSVSIMTRTKLNLKENWAIKEEKNDNDIEVSEVVEEAKVSVFDAIMEVDLEDFEEYKNTPIGDLQEFMGQLPSASFLSSMVPTPSISFPRKILNNVMNCKSLFVCRQLLSDMRINKSTIAFIVRSLKTHRDSILNCLIQYYDTLHHTNVDTPKGIHIDISEAFTTKFGIELEDLDDVLSD